MEAAVLVLDQVAQRLAVQRRNFVRCFRFQRAPFFQSFVEVRVERSRRRVVLVLNGAHGPLQWRDLQIGGTVVPPGATLDDPVEFIVPMERWNKVQYEVTGSLL